MHQNLQVENIGKLYVYEPGKSKKANEAILGTLKPMPDTGQQAAEGLTPKTCPLLPATPQQSIEVWTWANMKRALTWANITRSARKELDDWRARVREWWYNRRYVDDLKGPTP